MKRPRSYLSYLLRIWQSGRDEEAVWQASLECPLTRERQSFASLKDLFVFLETLVNSAASQEKDDRR